MRLRTYLILSYLALIALLFVGGWFIDAQVLGELTKSAIKIAHQAVSDVTATNIQYSDRILTRMGEYVVKDKAEDVARELAYTGKGKKCQITPDCVGFPAPGHRHPAEFTPPTVRQDTRIHTTRTVTSCFTRTKTSRGGTSLIGRRTIRRPRR